jgi:hypothetical protein
MTSTFVTNEQDETLGYGISSFVLVSYMLLDCQKLFHTLRLAAALHSREGLSLLSNA